MKNGEASVELEDVKRKPRNRVLTKGALLRIEPGWEP